MAVVIPSCFRSSAMVALTLSAEDVERVLLPCYKRDPDGVAKAPPVESAKNK